ncbi:MAG: PIN domain-containing protein [Nanoarchaeota archaeon]
MPKTAKIVLDTNFLMIPGQIGLDIFKEIERGISKRIELFICSGSLKELQKLTETGKGVNKRAAKLALELIENKNIQIIPTEPGHVDDRLVELSKQDYLIATQDLGLKKRLKKYVYLRQKKYIEIRGVMD